MLSATPFEYDYSDLYRQIDVFGFGGQQYLKIAGEQYSKNMYRREWRRGGYLVHDEPMALTDPRQRLVVGLMQKNVAEILGDRKFNNSFQIGMLSSFESFMESMARSRRLHVETNSDGEEESEDGENGEAVFDGRRKQPPLRSGASIRTHWRKSSAPIGTSLGTVCRIPNWMRRPPACARLSTQATKRWFSCVVWPQSPSSRLSLMNTTIAGSIATCGRCCRIYTAS